MNIGYQRTILSFFTMAVLMIIITPTTVIYAQNDDAEEIFWGDEEESFDEEFDFSDEDEEESFDEEFDFSEDDDMEGIEFDDASFEDDFEDEGMDDEFDDFSEDFSSDSGEEELSIAEAASKLGYTLSLIGASPGFVNHPLQTYNSGVDFRATFEFPMLLQIGPTRFRLGAEVGTFKFSNYKPIGGDFSGVHITGILSFPAGPGQVKLGGGVVGSGFGIIAENSYGFSVGGALDVRVGIRSTTALNVTDTKNNSLGTVSWMDGILVLGISL
tara:strand:+ start:246 stop:1058 length:813 start_codon:yes stop_codon:yes gene_type:complete